MNTDALVRALADVVREAARPCPCCGAPRLRPAQGEARERLYAARSRLCDQGAESHIPPSVRPRP